MTAWLVLAASLLASSPLAPSTATTHPNGLRGRFEGYRGLYPLHVAALRTRDLADPTNPAAWATVDPETGKFEMPLPADAQPIYLLGQLDFERMGPRLNGSSLFFLKKLPIHPANFQGKRLIFDLGDMELASVMRDQKGPGSAPWIAFGLAVLLYGIGFLWRRRLANTELCARPRAPSGGLPLLGIALGSTAAMLPNLGREALELLEFTYLHEGLRPDTIVALLSDPISAELSHPPLWPLILRAMAGLSRAEWWLRLPALLAHTAYVVVVYRLIAGASQSRGAGLLGAGIAALLPVGFYYGRDATPYALLGLVSGLAALCALEERWRLFAATLILGFFTHYTVAVLGVAIGLALFWTWRRERDDGAYRRALGAFGFVIALPLVWSVHFIRTFLASGTSTRLMSVDYLPDPGFLAYVAHFGTVVLGLPEELSSALPVALTAAVAGAIIAVRRWPRLGRIVAIQLAMVVVYVLFVHGMYMRFAGGRVFYAYRWSSVFLPAVAVCYTAFGIALYERRRWAGVLFAALLLGGSAIQDARIALQPQRPDQWAAARTIEEERRANDAFCALPAVYYGQLFNYALFDRQPKDLLAWPRWTTDPPALYGPLHPRNTTIETLSRSLAFERLWVGVFHERMFGTRKFDPATSAHQIEWMQEQLIPDGHWSYDHMELYRFRVPNDPGAIWKDGRLELVFSKQLQQYRYFPELLHTQSTGLIMSQSQVAVRVPAPEPRPAVLALEIEATIGEPLTASDLSVDSVPLTFATSPTGGTWRGTIPVAGDRIDLRLQRSTKHATKHRNTILRLRLP